MKVFLKLAVIAALTLASQAWAYSSFSRKYQIACSLCHTGFARLTPYGERFARNGFQDPNTKEADGGAVGKKAINSKLVLGNLTDNLSVRINSTLLRFDPGTGASGLKLYVTNQTSGGITTNNLNKWTAFQSMALGLHWVGTIAKNVSISGEFQFSPGLDPSQSASFTASKLNLGFYNIGGTFANLKIGQVSPREFAPYASPSGLDVSAENGSSGTEKFNGTGSRWGVSYYGYAGPVTWYGGLGTGMTSTVLSNLSLNLWAGAKFEIEEAWSPVFDGSSIGAYIMGGNDTKNVTASVPGGILVTNNWGRFIGDLNLRAKNLDLRSAFMYGVDNNYTMVSTNLTNNVYAGFAATASYLIGDKDGLPLLYPTVTVSTRWSDIWTNLNATTLSASVAVFPLENFKLTLSGSFPISSGTSGSNVDISTNWNASVAAQLMF